MMRSRRRFLQSATAVTGVVTSALSAGAAQSAPESKKPTEEKGTQRQTPAEPLSPPKLFARALGFEESVAYRPAKRPGYCSWVTVWKAPDGSLLLNLCERRKLPNPIYRPIPLDFWEAMMLPIKYQSQLLTDPDILPENVILQSRDQGKSWKEVGRSVMIFEPFAFTSLPDGSILCGVENAYTAYYASEKVVCTVQKSTDLGNTWVEIARLEDNFWFMPYRMMLLHDGTVAMLGIYQNTFGPGRDVGQRSELPPYSRTQVQAAIFFSHDNGVNWDGPIPVMPGVTAWEPDWVELPSGDLLVINCSVQGGANTRQFVRRQGKRFIPQGVLDIVSGSVPETLVITKEGLLVGTRRGGIYSCSKDLGSTWYPIGDLPHALYQPRIIQLDDGRFLSEAHFGADNFVGEVDQYVGQHVFRLEEHLPTPTTLALERDRNAAGTQYINAYTATLKTGTQPLADREVKFTVRAATRGRRSYKTEEFARRTDAAGNVHLSLPDFDKSIDIHRDYSVVADFSPSANDESLTAARSRKYAAYRLSSTARQKNTYAFYVAGERLFVEKSILERFPEIEPLVKAFGLKSNFSAAELEKELKLTSERGKALVEVLLRNRVLRSGENGSYVWNEVELKEVAAITVNDDFLP